MAIDPRTPVLVGAALVQQRGAHPGDGGDAVHLMVEALHGAVADAGAPGLLAAIEQVSTPEGTGGWADPARLVADAAGVRGSRDGSAPVVTVRADVGILQQDLLTDACHRIGRGELDVVAVVGGEAKHRAQQAAAAGVDLAVRPEPAGCRPDRRLSPASLGVHDLEITRNAVTPATSYALMDQAVGHARGRSPEQHRQVLGARWAAFAAVAAANPHAWDRSGPDAAAVLEPTPANRMVSWPYTKLLCSQWNVDQAEALVLCSAAAAERHGVPRDRWVFPHAAATSDHAVPVLQRAQLHACAGADLATARALALAGVGPDDLAHIDLYSCFPVAVEALARPLGLADGAERPLTVTGGMAFGGGPLNNYALHALATMVPLLRADAGSFGLSTSISGFLVKQGVGLWSTSPPAAGFRHEDVSSGTAAALAASDGILPVDEGHVGPATVASWTVVPGRDDPGRAVAVCDVGAGPGRARTLATSHDPDLVAAMGEGDWIGHPVHVDAHGTLLVAGLPR
jgi:acetyl-CoA C-acetyltransferase